VEQVFLGGCINWKTPPSHSANPTAIFDLIRSAPPRFWLPEALEATTHPAFVLQ
jgi:hypothetical protein